MDWRYEYIDLEKIRELMEKTDGWSEEKQEEFYGYLLDKKDEFFRSEFGELFLQMYKEKLGVPDLEIIRQRRAKQSAPKEEQPRRFWLLRSVPVVLLAVAVSAGSIWIYRKAEDQSAKKHLESLQASMAQDGAGDVSGETNGIGGASGHNEAGLLEAAGGNSGASGTSQAAGGSGAQGTSQTSDAKGTLEGTRPPVLAQYRELSAQYPELFGWLTIPDTGINYPVMQSAAEKDYYLHHNFEGASDDEGALFVDPESSIYPMDDNLVVYGHNMKNGHMFGELKNYGVESYFLSNQEILFNTLYETARYEVVTVMQTHIKDEAEEGFRYYQFFNYTTEAEFRECVDFIEENQIYEAEKKLKYGDRLLMLSTCDYAQDNGRFVVVARKTEG